MLTQHNQDNPDLHNRNNNHHNRDHNCGRCGHNRDFSTTPPAPALIPDLKNLTLESTLTDLWLYDATIDLSRPSQDAKQWFEQQPLLPGLILVDRDTLIGMVSRQRFFECLSRPFGLEVFLKRPLQVLSGFIETDGLLISSDTPIVQATRQSLSRTPEMLYEPIVVTMPDGSYRLLDTHQLFIAQSRIHELATQLLHEQTQAQMIQTEKLSTLGRMLAGVAHEVLNPVNFIKGNVEFLTEYFQDLLRLVKAYESTSERQSEVVLAIRDEIDFDYLEADALKILNSMAIGVERLTALVGSLRNFSHMQDDVAKPMDLHTCLDNTLLILNNRLKYGITVNKQYGELPPITCYAGQLSQVFMNLITNAIDALNDRQETLKQETQQTDTQQTVGAQSFSQPSPGGEPDWRPTITLVTAIVSAAEAGLPAHPTSSWVSIRIRDNGPGIPANIQERIFETFFTTKPMGKGTGLGLAISHQIVTQKHGGLLRFQSELGIGTEFEILLPLDSIEGRRDHDGHSGLVASSSSSS
ncbi:sensor histidine kinase [Trichothermofontia sp.]